MTILEELFDASLPTAQSAARYDIDGQAHMVVDNLVLIYPQGQEPDHAMLDHMRHVPKMLLNRPELLRPENLCLPMLNMPMPELVREGKGYIIGVNCLPAKDPGEVWCIDKATSQATRVDPGKLAGMLPLRRFGIPEGLEVVVQDEDVSAVIGIGRMKPEPVLMLSDKQGRQVFMAMEGETRPAEIHVIYLGKDAWALDGWQEDKKQYKSLRKKKMNSLLKNPLKKSSPEPLPPKEEITEEDKSDMFAVVEPKPACEPPVIVEVKEPAHRAEPEPAVDDTPLDVAIETPQPAREEPKPADKPKRVRQRVAKPAEAVSLIDKLALEKAAIQTLLTDLTNRLNDYDALIASIVAEKDKAEARIGALKAVLDEQDDNA